MKKRLLVSVSIGITLWLLLPEVAYADNCSVESLSDCFGTARAAATAAVALAVFAAILSMTLDMIPIVGTVKGIIEAVTGRDLITGEKLEDWERLLGIVPWGKLGKVFKMVAPALGTGAMIAGVIRHADDVPDLERGLRRATDLIDDLSSTPRAGENIADVERRVQRAEAEISRRYASIEGQGHGPARHGAHITEQQLKDRAMYSIDPVTGTTTDAYRKLPNGSPAPHAPTRHATKIKTERGYVQGEDYMRNSQQYKDELARAAREGDTQLMPQGVPLKDIYGPNYRLEVDGITREGSANYPTGSKPTDLTDGTMKAIYRADGSGGWRLHTMYPEPKNVP